MTGWPEGVRCTLMRGGTSKGAYFLADDLPADPAARDELLLRVMGSPDPRQIDGLGGAHPLTSKVAVVSASADPDADVDYLFLQVGVDNPEVSDHQNCGNLLAGVGPFAVERGLVAARDPETSVRIRMLNTGDLAVATFPTPGGRIAVTGDTEISGVPGTGAPVMLEFPPSGSPLLPTANARDVVAGTEVTCVDNGMPTVLIPAAALKVTGYQSPEELETDPVLTDRLREIRLEAGKLMGLGDVARTTVPKLSLLAPPRDGGAVTTRTFIPVRCHTSIGVLGAASVAAGLRVEGGVGDGLAQLPLTGERLRIEHPTGFLDIETRVTYDPDGRPAASRTAVVRTARKIFDGTVFPRPAEPPLTLKDPLMAPPLGDIAHLGHVELLTPDLDRSLWFFTEILGLTENGRSGGSVYLRTWDDYEHHSLTLTAHSTSGIRRTALRTSSEEALQRRVKELENTGRAGRWVEDEPGIGPLYVTTDPDGHEVALYWKSEWYEAPDDLKPGLKNQPQAKPGHGVGVRRLDHVNFLASDVATNAAFTCEVLGARATEQIVLDTGKVAAQWLTFTNKSYDVVYTEDWTGSQGRLHHIAFATDTREDILRAADLCLDQDVFIETGPHKHAIQQTFFLYVYEPGGNRIELCHPLTRLVLAPDWPLITWTQAERAKGQAWGLKTIESFHTHGTPPVD